MNTEVRQDWEAQAKFLARETRTSLWRIDFSSGTSKAVARADLLGFREEDVQQKFNAWLELVHPDERDAVRGRMEALYRGEVERISLENRVRNPEGQWRCLRSVATAAGRTPEGLATEIMGASWEITEPKNIERRLRMSQSVLEKITKQAPLEEILASLVAAAENRSEGTYAAILLLDPESTRLHLAAVEEMPAAFRERLEAMADDICGERCRTSDLTDAFPASPSLAEPWCHRCREAATNAGLHSCQSRPLMDSSRRPLGVVLFCYAELHKPTHEEEELLAEAARLAAVAVERHLAQQALRKTEERLERALWGANIGLWDADLAADEVFLSDQWYRMVGCERTGKPLRVHDLLSMVHPDDLPGLIAAWEEHAAGNSPYFESEHRLQAPGGPLRWVCDRARIIQRDANGRPLRISGTQYEITARKEMELELRRSESRFQSFMEHLPAVAFIKDAQGHYIYGNRQWGRQFDAAPASLYGKTQRDLFPSEVAEGFEAGDAEVLQGSEMEDSVVSMTTSAGQAWWLVRRFAIPMLDGPPLIGGLGLEVTRQRQMENDLRESEERFRLLAESVRIIPWEWSTVENRYNYIGPQAEQVFGWTTDQWLEPLFWERHIHPDELQPALQFCKERGERADHYELDYRFLTKKGDWVWVHDVVSVVRQHGRPAILRGFMLDITDHKRVEAALRESESRLRSLAENAPDFILQVNPEHRITFINHTIPPHTTESTLGMVVEDFLPPSQQASVRMDIDRVFRTGRPGSYEVNYDGQNGVTHWFSVRLGPVFQDGKVESVILISREVTDQRLATEALRESEARYRLLANNSSDMITRLLPDGRFAYASPAARRIMGYDPEELIGEKFDFLVAPEDLERLYEEVAKVVSERSTQVVTYRLRRKDGTFIFAESKGQPVVDAETGLVRELIVNTRDVTDRLETARRLQERESQLAHAERLTTMGQMASELAHEINQPLYAIANFADACLSTLKQGRPSAADDLKNWLGQIATQARRAADIVRRVNHFVRKGDSERSFFDLSDCVREVMPLIEVNARRNHVAVVLELNGDLPEVYADRLLIEQVLTNLIRNGVEAMSELPAGRPRRLTIRTFRAGSESVGTAVVDVGSGIASEDMDRLFEPYFTTKDTGTGMGLSICRTVIEAHRGRIWAANNEAGGATFQFVLPAHPDQPEEPDLPRPS